MRTMEVLIRLCLLCVLPVAGWSAGTDDAPRSGKARAADELFDGTNVVQIQIDIPRAGMVVLRGSGWGNRQDRPEAKATVREGNTVYTNVSIHLKGAAGSFRSIDDNPALTLNFEEYAPDQAFHGLRKISLNNSVQDRSFLCEKICRELFHAAGVPVPRAAYAVVQLNGRNLGLRVLIEGYNKQFLKRYFKNPTGNLYDGGFVQDINSSLDLNSGDKPQDHTRLRALVSAASDSDPNRRWLRLQETLDMDRFLAFVAMEVMLCHWDGYAMNRNNWRLYHDLDSNKMVFMPHGLDQMFGVDRSSPESPIFPSMQGMVARAVLGNPQGRRLYLAKLCQLYTNVFQVDSILKRVDELNAMIRPVLTTSNPQAAAYHTQQAQRLKSRISQRDDSLKRQLEAYNNPPQFAANGAMQLKGWKFQVRSGSPLFRDPQGQDSNCLYIGANGNTVASWRMRLLLEPGTYRFEGKIRTRDVRADGEGTGAELRISRGSVPEGLTGTSPWRDYIYPFLVQDNGAAVEFVCELSATKGEVWFDASSLRVVRVR
jgi:spore coat protein H